MHNGRHVTRAAFVRQSAASRLSERTGVPTYLLTKRTVLPAALQRSAEMPP